MASDLELLPFASEHLDAAAELLARRQRALRAVRAELPVAYTEAAACRPLLEAIVDQVGSRGIVAHTGTGMAGFLLGYPRYEPIWGRACWSPLEGQAYDPAAGPDIMRDIYTVWSQHFVDRGFFRQYVYAPADDAALLDTWFLTGFGRMQAQAARDLDLDPPSGTSFTVRRVTLDDLNFIEPLLGLIPMGLVKSPAYAITLPEWFAELRGEYAEELANPASLYWLAEEDGQAIGLAGFVAEDPGLRVPEGAWYLQDAKTAPAARGRGVMRALVAAAFAEARASGARHCVTDWRTASLPAHRTWTALGFRPTDFRLHRQIDERIAWANGRQV
ncbi:MAG: GNAT family N-acetyltransferase [Candidatus Limnocylindria bacterium]